CLPSAAAAEPKWPLEAEQPTLSGETTPWPALWASTEQPLMVAASRSEERRVGAVIEAVTERLPMLAVVAAVSALSWELPLSAPVRATSAVTCLPSAAAAEPKWPLEAEQPTLSGETTPWPALWASTEQPLMVAASVPS